MKILMQKSMLAELQKSIDKRRFEYFKEKVLEHLEELAEEENEDVKKSLLAFENSLSAMEKSGYPVGTKRQWKGKWYIKVAPNKWRPYYDKHSRGAKLSIKALMKKVDACQNSEDLLQLILENKARFSDEMGRPLPFVKELSEYASKRNDEIESGAKKVENGKAKGKTKLNQEATKNTSTQTGIRGKLRQELKNNLREYFKEPIPNEKTGIKANLSGKSVDKMGSDKAIEKSKNNGFTVKQHFEVANKIVELYKKADLIETNPDKKKKNENEGLESVKRFSAETTLSNGEKVNAWITVKESYQHGHKIYSVELQEINKASEKTDAFGDKVANQDDSKGAIKSPLSDSTIPQSENLSTQKENPSLDELEKAFNDSNKDPENAALFKDVMRVARNLGVTVKYKTMSDKTGGEYEEKENVVYINSKIKGTDHFPITALHELIHSVTSRVLLTDDKNLTATQIEGKNEIKEVYKAVKAHAGADFFMNDYGLKNEHEMVAELANPKFREALKKTSLFKKLIGGIAKLFTREQKNSENIGNSYDKLKSSLYKIIDNYKPTFTKDFESNDKTNEAEDRMKEMVDFINDHGKKGFMNVEDSEVDTKEKFDKLQNLVTEYLEIYQLYPKAVKNLKKINTQLKGMAKRFGY